MKEKRDPQVFKIEGKLFSVVLLLKEKLAHLGIDVNDRALLIKGDEITIK